MKHKKPPPKPHLILHAMSMPNGAKHELIWAVDVRSARNGHGYFVAATSYYPSAAQALKAALL